MKKIFYILLLITPIYLSSCDFLSGLTEDNLTEDEIIDGLKTALKVGTDSSTNELNKEDGYFGNPIIKILLPPEADPILDIIDNYPIFNQHIDSVVLRINRTAENAAVQAKPIFVDAITDMTIQDGLNILNGVSTLKSDFDSTAATSYLRAKTYTKLFSLYQPIIKTTLDKKLVGDYSTNETWYTLTATYNLLVLPEDNINTALDEFATGKALDGLFYKVGIQEKKIRKDPFQWAIDILDKVFGSVYQEE